MKITVIGASGQLGRLAIEQFRSKAAGLGVEVRETDYTHPDVFAELKEE